MQSVSKQLASSLQAVIKQLFNLTSKQHTTDKQSANENIGIAVAIATSLESYLVLYLHHLDKPSIVGCNTDSDCATGMRAGQNCDVNDGHCFMCHNDGDCSDHRNKFCRNGKCEGKSRVGHT